jgi:hypothetical protein
MPHCAVPQSCLPSLDFRVIVYLRAVLKKAYR